MILIILKIGAILLCVAIIAACVILFLSGISRFNRNPNSWKLWNNGPYSRVGHRHR